MASKQRVNVSSGDGRSDAHHGVVIGRSRRGPAKPRECAVSEPAGFIDRLLAVLADQAVLVVNENTSTIERSNQAAEELFGVSDLHGLPLLTVYDSEEALRSFNAEISENSDRKRRDQWRARLRRSDGHSFDAEISVRPILEGRPERAYIIRDLSGRLDAETRLRDSERRFRQVVEASPMGMHFFELRGRELILTGANPAADHILGRTHAELLGLPIERVLPGLVGTEALSRLRRVASRGGQWHDHAFEYTDDAASGTFDVAAFRHSRNQVATVFVDVTQRRLVEEKERRYRTRLSAMAAQLTATEDSERRKLAEELHDRVGQPLAVARMHLNSACTLEGGIDPGELALAQELLEDAIRQTRTITISLSPPVLYELGLHAALRWLRDELSEHYDLMVHLGPAADESGVSVEAKLVLFRAAHELALNVVKHSGTREAWMVLKSIDGWFTLTVLDQGCGLSSEVQASGMGESGFGLFSIKERVPHLGGRFDAQSGSGLGAVVSVSVPQSPVQ